MISIAVSPDYRQTGLVVVVAHQMAGCKGHCGNTLWITHNGGHNWWPMKGTGWDGQPPTIAVAPTDTGHETLFAGGNSGLQRSDDYGASWRAVPGAGSGFSATSPNYAKDETLAVASGTDYLLKGSAVHSVTGSGGAIADEKFFFSPSFPTAGSYSPVLLGGWDKHASLPVIERCGLDFSCSGTTPLAGATALGGPADLHLSSTYSSDGVVFAQIGAGVYKSLNGGASFVQLPMGLPPADSTAITAMGLAPGYSEHGSVRTAYASVLQVHVETRPPSSSGGVFASNDGGASWHRVGSPSPLDGGSTFLAVAPDGRLFAGYVGTSTYADAGLLCSEDRGASWHDRCSSVGTWSPNASSTGSSKSSPTACAGSACAAGGAAGGGASTSGTGGAAGANSGANDAAEAANASVNPGRATSRLPMIAGGVAGALAVAAVVSGLVRRRLHAGPETS